MSAWQATLRLHEQGETPRASMGGNPFLPVGSRLPICNKCGHGLVLFFQFDIEDHFDLPFESGNHLVVMMCPVCNEIPTFERYKDGILPPDFWNETLGHFFVALYRPSKITEVQAPQYLKVFALEFDRLEDGVEPENSLRVGGQPIWFQEPERYVCPCGAEMKFVCQLSKLFGFPKYPAAPEQPDSFSRDEYCLFLGNEVYVFACPQQCSERSVWIALN